MDIKNVHENVKTRVGGVRENVKQRVEELKVKKRFPMHRIIFALLGVFLVLEGIFFLEEIGRFTLPPEYIVVARAVVLVILSFVIVSAFITLTEGLIPRLLGKDAEAEQRIFFTKMYSFVLYLGTIAFVLYRMGVTAQNITLFIGLIATGIALAMREVLVSFMVWFMLLMKKPFRIGDYIKIGDDMGKVLHIGTFYVIIDGEEDLESEILRIPNKTFLEKNVQNFGKEGIYLDKVRIPFKGMPDDMDARVADAERFVKENLPGKSTVYVETYKEWAYLVVKYPVLYDERHELRTKIMLRLAPHTTPHKHAEKHTPKGDKAPEEVLAQ